MSLLRLLGEPEFRPARDQRPAVITWPYPSYRRLFRWRTRAVALALLIGLLGGLALSEAATSRSEDESMTLLLSPVDVSRPAERTSAPPPSRRPEPTGTLAPAATPEVGSPPPAPGGSQDLQAAVWHQDPEISFFGPGLYGRRTACGLALTTALIGVAHRTLPCGTLVEFRWRGVVLRVPVVDRGPYVAGRQWDLTGGACTVLDHCWTGPIEWRVP